MEETVTVTLQRRERQITVGLGKYRRTEIEHRVDVLRDGKVIFDVPGGCDLAKKLPAGQQECETEISIHALPEQDQDLQLDTSGPALDLTESRRATAQAELLGEED